MISTPDLRQELAGPFQWAYDNPQCHERELLPVYLAGQRIHSPWSNTHVQHTLTKENIILEFTGLQSVRFISSTSSTAGQLRQRMNTYGTLTEGFWPQDLRSESAGHFQRGRSQRDQRQLLPARILGTNLQDAFKYCQSINFSRTTNTLSTI